MAKSTAPKTELSTEIKSFHQGSQPQVPTNFGTTKPTPIVMTVDWKTALKARIEKGGGGTRMNANPDALGAAGSSELPHASGSGFGHLRVERKAPAEHREAPAAKRPARFLRRAGSGRFIFETKQWVQISATP